MLAATAASWGQTAGTRAVINSDNVPVYAQMTTERPAIRVLERHEVVVIGLVLFGDEVTWCAVSRPGETKRLGYISCEFVEPEKAHAAEAASSRGSEPKPEIRVRAVEAPQPKVRELAPAAVAAAEAEPAPPEVAPDRFSSSKSIAPADAVSPPARETRTSSASPLPDVAETRPPAISTSLHLAAHAGPPVAAILPPWREEATPPPAAPAREPAAAEAPSPQPVLPADFARGAIEASALKSQIALFVRANYALSFLDKNRLATVDLEALGQLFRKHFRPALFQWPVQALLQKEAQAPEAVWLSDWLNDATTARMERLAREAAGPEAHARLVEFAGQLRKSPPRQERLRLIHRLYEATQACEIEVETTLAAVRGLAEALNPLLPEERRFGSAELARALQEVRKAYQPVMKNAKLVHYLFAFETASDEELEQYVRGWESAGGRWWVAIQRKGFASGARTLAANLRAAVPRALGTSGLSE